MGKIAKLAGACALAFTAMVAISVYRHYLPPPEFKTYRGLNGVSSNDLLSVKMERMAEQAAMDAWKRCRIRVHIGIHSLPEFERYLGLLSKSQMYRSLPPKDKDAEAIIAGAFVGEAIRRTHGGTWLEKSDIPASGPYPLKIRDKSIWPVTWCLKRLVNGPEDNVHFKYVTLVLGRTNEIHGELTYWTNAGTELKKITNIIVR